MSSPIEFFLRRISAPSLPNVFNPWGQRDPDLDGDPQAPSIRQENLRRYFSQRRGQCRYLFLGEAIGWRGGRFSGIAMCSERLLFDGFAPQGLRGSHVFDGPKTRTSRPALFPTLPSEATALAIWSTMHELGADPFSWAVWNTFPWHPHQPQAPCTNRTPLRAEIDSGRSALDAVLEILQPEAIFAVGRIAASTLEELGLDAKPLRHPAHGGIPAFKRGVAAAISPAPSAMPVHHQLALSL